MNDPATPTNSTTPTKHASLIWRLGLNLPSQYRVFAAFFLYSFSMGGFYPRLPELQRQLGVAEGALGFSITGVATGTLVSLTFLAPLIGRIGSRWVMLAMIPGIAAAYALAAHASSPILMFGALFLGGLVMGCVETVVNVEADRVEHQIGRRIMSRSHAFWSFGFFSAGAFSTLATKWLWSPQQQLLITVPMVIIAAILLLGKFEPAPDRHTEHADAGQAAPRWALPTPRILLLVACCASALLLEGAGIDWSAIYMRDIFQSPASVSAMAVSVVALAQASMRFVADGFIERFTPVVVARSLLTLLFIGTAMVAFASQPSIAMIGFALIGVGSSAIFPLAISAAAQSNDRPAAVNVAALAQTGFIVFLLAPPTLGFVAEHLGIRWSFGITLPLVLLSLLVSHILQPVKATPKPAADKA